MEEILASIRRIISEDDAPAAEGPAEEAPAEEPPAAEAELPTFPEEEPEEEVLELTEKVDSVGDLDIYAPSNEPEPEPEPAPAPARSYTPAYEAEVGPGEGLVGDPAAAAAAAAFGALSSSLLMPADGRTLEDVVRELLRPLLKGWLDENLPGIVEAAVKAEVERIARGRVR